MAQRLKSWESPRREGRNSKGKGGAARARQLKKQQQRLRQKLQGETQDNQGKRTLRLFPFYWGCRQHRRICSAISYKMLKERRQPLLMQ